MSIYLGIDWSQDKHDVAFINAAGTMIARLTIPIKQMVSTGWKRRGSSWL